MIRKNYFRTPNWVIDNALPFLTPQEFKCFMYLTRKISGWQKDEDCVSLSQICKGVKAFDGRVIDRGTGLSPNAVKKAIKGLLDANLVIKVQSGKSFKQPTKYRLQDDLNGANDVYLVSRRRSKKMSNLKRTVNARETLARRNEIAEAENFTSITTVVE